MCYISILGFKNTLDYFLSSIRIKNVYYLVKAMKFLGLEKGMAVHGEERDNKQCFHADLKLYSPK